MLREFFVIALAHQLAVMSPGPDFAIVSKIAVRNGRSAGRSASLGIALGIATHICVSLLGFAALLKSNQALFEAVRITGALYLGYIAYKSIKAGLQLRINSQPKDKIGVPILSRRGALYQGYITNITNPKATLFFLTIFTQVVSISTPVVVKFAYGLEMVLATYLWFWLVSASVNITKVRRVYEEQAWKIEIAFGVVLLLIACLVLKEVIL